VCQQAYSDHVFEALILKRLERLDFEQPRFRASARSSDHLERFRYRDQFCARVVRSNDFWQVASKPDVCNATASDLSLWNALASTKKARKPGMRKTAPSINVAFTAV
jgi:hypothetical protein